MRRQNEVEKTKEIDLKDVMEKPYIINILSDNVIAHQKPKRDLKEAFNGKE